MKKEDYNKGVKKIQKLTGTSDNLNDTFKLNIKSHNITNEEAMELRQKLIDEYSKEKITYTEIEARLNELIREYTKSPVVESNNENEIKISFNSKNNKNHIEHVNTIHDLINVATILPSATLNEINKKIISKL
ncbi:MAG: hypothetical protein E7Z84_09070 [Methanosphaera stadtmanae]|nr:hypothetical protein [Methanosphaera stadtmanae]